MDQKVSEVFSSQPMVNLRNPRNLSSYLVRAKFYPLEKWVGSYKFRCNCCQVFYTITETDMFICNNNHKAYKINHSFDCSGKYLLYLLPINCCQKHYIGQTVDITRNRSDDYKDYARNFDRGEQ